MTHALTPLEMLDPARVRALANAAAGHEAFDLWALLDPARAEAQLNTLTGASHFRGYGPLSRGFTDPLWSPPDFTVACGT